MTENNDEDQRPSKMIGVVFPKAKYGVIAAIIIIIGGNLVYYKEAIFSFFKSWQKIYLKLLKQKKLNTF